MTARKAYLRAAEYWRQSIFFIRHDLDDPRLQGGYQAHRKAFRAAIPFMPWAVETIEIAFDGARMGGYLLRPDMDRATSRPTLLIPCGYDSTAEAGYCTAAYMALPRGYNVLLWDGPGQGGMLYEQRRPMRRISRRCFRRSSIGSSSSLGLMLAAGVDWPELRRLSRASSGGLRETTCRPGL